MTLIGAWNSEEEADREILAHVADQGYETIEGEVMRLLQFDDSPVWSARSHRGVVSKMDALFAIGRMITPEDLRRLFVAAENVLSETDPALDLPEEERWAAALYDKTRVHSGAIREGICETLVILSVHGNDLFQSRLGIDIEARVSAKIRKLLTPMTLEKLLSQDDNLPYYAEAAPDEFLQIIEGDLSEREPVIYGLLKPVDSGSPLASPSRTGLLWALECLAWNPRNLSRVCKILAQLSKPIIDDNWINKPDASLQAIFRSWMPQTAASVEQRIKALNVLIRNFSDVGWSICLDQIKPRTRFGHGSYRPRWRSDASGAGQVVTPKERYDFTREALGLAIAWPSHDEATLGDLIEALEVIPEEEQTKIWDLVDQWSCRVGESAKAALRERIRRFALTRRARHLKIGETARDRVRQAYEELQPRDPVIRHRWLFVSQWLQESAHEFEEEDFDWRKRDERIDRLRREAAMEIWTEYRFEGVRNLLTASGTPHTVGHYAMSCVTSTDERVEFIRHCLSLDGDQRNQGEWCLQGALSAVEDNSCTWVLKAAAEAMPSEECKRLFVCAPFRISDLALAGWLWRGYSSCLLEECVPVLGSTHACRAHRADRQPLGSWPPARGFQLCSYEYRRCRDFLPGAATPRRRYGK